MKQTAVDFLINIIDQKDWINYTTEERLKVFEQAKEMEKQQIIDAGNRCALKQHLYSDRINEMSREELELYDLETSYTFGEEHYNETFN
jgi:hypothetical protein